MRALVFTLLVLVLAAFGLVYFDIVQIDIDNPFAQKTVAAPAPPQDLFEVAKTGSLEQVEAALAAGEALGQTDAYGQTPLMYAAGSNPDPMVVRALLRAGANVNARSQAGWTALMYAVRDNENPEVVMALLNAGANPTLRNDQGQLAVDLASENGKVRRS
ncbi:MAG TPA: ankyrin repeat domain-containing protein, partial [Trueperaceae bacterium]